MEPNTGPVTNKNGKPFWGETDADGNNLDNEKRVNEKKLESFSCEHDFEKQWPLGPEDHVYERRL